MNNQAETWHYGIMALYWTEYMIDAGPELEYFQNVIKMYGEPALDLACGTGRLLVPLLKAGIDIDGTDISPDMLAGCAKRARSDGFDPHLYAQASHELELPRTYRTIIACGTIGIGGEWEHDMEALRRCYKVLEPGGVLALDCHLGDGLPFLDKENEKNYRNRGHLFRRPKSGSLCETARKYSFRFGRLISIRGIL